MLIGLTLLLLITLAAPDVGAVLIVLAVVGCVAIG